MDIRTSLVLKYHTYQFLPNIWRYKQCQCAFFYPICASEINFPIELLILIFESNQLNVIFLFVIDVVLKAWEV